jgi:hypothetical protein
MLVSIRLPTSCLMSRFAVFVSSLLLLLELFLYLALVLHEQYLLEQYALVFVGIALQDLVLFWKLLESFRV